MKRIITIFLLFISIFTFAQKKTNGLYGNVRCCKTITMNAKSQFGQVVTLDTTRISETTYNIEGSDIGSRLWTPTKETITIYELNTD